jgi:hypothetical protein
LVLKAFLPACIAKLVCSKSLRKGATTEMAIHPYLDHKFLLLRSGHSSQYNDRHYTASVTAGSLPGFKALAGWPLTHSKVASPSLGCLPQSKEALIEKLYIISIPEFKINGRLYPLIKVCTASLIMSFKDFNRAVGQSNAVTLALVNAVKLAD